MKKFIVAIFLLFVVFYSFNSSTENVQEKYSKYFVKNEKLVGSSLKVTFLGVSTLLFQDEKNAILIDGFVSRPSLQTLLFSKIKSDEKIVDEVIKKIKLQKLDAVIPLHSHHDHALDAPLFAKKFNAKIIGSKSTINIAKAYNIKDSNLITIKGRSSFKIGEFEVLILPSKHTEMPAVLSFLVGLEEEIEKPLKKEEYFTSFKEGGTFSVYIKHNKNSFFINGSTGYKEGLTEDLKADTVFLGIAKFGKKSKEFQKAYYTNIVKNLNPKRVVPIHWDDFTKGLNEPISTLPKTFDSFDKSMQFLVEKSANDNFKLQLMGFYDSLYF